MSGTGTAAGAGRGTGLLDPASFTSPTGLGSSSPNNADTEDPPSQPSPRPQDRPEDTPQDRRQPGSRPTSAGNAISRLNGQGSEDLVLTPSRLRSDSTVVGGFAASQACNAIFVALLLSKLTGAWDMDWGHVFIPLVGASIVDLPVRYKLLASTAEVMTLQVGPPPPLSASAGLHLQYDLVLRIRKRTHVCDHVASLLEAVAHILVKVVFASLLAYNKLSSVQLRVVLVPAWVAWACSWLLNCMKDPSERSMIGLRDLAYIFWLMVACKADGLVSYDWRIVFMVPWLWFAVAFMFSMVLVVTLMLARAWRRWKVLLLPLGFTGFLLSQVPMFLGLASLSSLLDNPDGSADYTGILLPILVSFVCMTLSLATMCWALWEKEQLRQGLLASGAVWTAHEGVARRMHQNREMAQRHVDALPEEEVARLVQELMAGKARPGVLMRVGGTLYRRTSGDEDSADLLMQPEGRSPSSAAAHSVTKSDAAGPGAGGQSPSQRSAVTPAAAPAAGQPGSEAEGGTAHLGGASSPAAAAGGHVLPLAAAVASLPLEHGAFASQPQEPLRSTPLAAGAASTAGPAEAGGAAPNHGNHVALDIPVLEASASLVGPGSQASVAGPGLGPSPRVTASQALPGDANAMRPGAPLGSETGSLTRTRPSSATHPPSRPSPHRPPLRESSHGPTHFGWDRQGQAAGGQVARPAPLQLGLAAASSFAAREQPAAQGGQAADGAAPNGSVAAPAADSQAAAAATLTGLFDGRLLGIRTQNTVSPTTPGDAADEDNGLCVICYDNEATCVFLECGHGGFCVRCAHRIFVRPPGECPSCRQRIEQVVELEEVGAVGQKSRVKR